MKHSLALALCLWPVPGFAQTLYTNADLVNFQVPGAYTNQDLGGKPALPVREAAVAPPVTRLEAPFYVSIHQARYEDLRLARTLLAAELEIEMERVAFSESAFAGDTREFAPRLGYRAQARPLILELEKRLALLDVEIDALADESRRAGAPITDYP